MSLKLPVSTVSLCLFTALICPTVYAQSTSNQKINQRINYLQHQIDELRAQVKQNKKIQKQQAQKNHRSNTHLFSVCRSGECQYNPGRVSIGPYLNQDSLYDGSNLLVNIPTVREASRLLEQQAKVQNEVKKLHLPPPPTPRLVFSGYLEGRASYSNPYVGSSVNDINLSGAELDTYVEATPWVHGYMALDYDSDEKANGSRVFLNRAFIVIGNLNKLPIYGEVGQIYVPFGRYSSGFITAPMPLAMARTRARSLVLGVQQLGSNAFHGELYAYQGLTNAVDKSNTNNEGGADVGYNFKVGRFSGYVGASIISNLADSQGFQSTAFLNNEPQDYRVPAYDVYASFSVAPVVFIGEYVSAMRHFAFDDLAYANRGAKPNSYNLELDYTFNTGSKPSSVGITYQRSSEALALGLPHERYGIVYNINIWKDTNFAVEYRHDINYSNTTVTTRGGAQTQTPPAVAADLGKSDDVITAQFDLYF